MRVLCIEDQEQKFNALKVVLQSSFNADIVWARSVSASLGLLASSWDLIVLDMNFPGAGAGGQERARSERSGIRVLQVMTSQNISVPVLVATTYDSFGDNNQLRISGIAELETFLDSAFPGIFRGVIRVDYASNEWHERLIQSVKELRLE